jgi:hypothetical protein
MLEKTNKKSKLMQAILVRCNAAVNENGVAFSEDEFEKFVGIIVDQCATEIVIDQHKAFWMNKQDFSETAAECAAALKSQLGV